MRFLISRLAGLVCLCCAATACGKEPSTPPNPPGGIKAVRDLDYGGKDNPRQKLDLYLPERKPDKPLPLIVYIHGGGWEEGSKNDAGIVFTVLQEGQYAAAALNYRLSDEAKWPAQIHDCKAALRWLGAHAAEYHIDASRIGLFGISAGGHLVSLLGTSSDIKELDGDVGVKGDAPKISCIVDFAGPSNFPTFGGKGSLIEPEKPGSAIYKLFGGPMSEHLAEAKAASPITYVTPDDPAFLIVHGTKDVLVPYAQAEEFHAALTKAGVYNALLTGQAGPHVFVSMDLVMKMRTFFNHYLLGTGPNIKDGPVDVKWNQ